MSVQAPEFDEAYQRALSNIERFVKEEGAGNGGAYTKFLNHGYEATEGIIRCLNNEYGPTSIVTTRRVFLKAGHDRGEDTPSGFGMALEIIKEMGYIEESEEWPGKYSLSDSDLDEIIALQWALFDPGLR